MAFFLSHVRTPHGLRIVLDKLSHDTDSYSEYLQWTIIEPQLYLSPATKLDEKNDSYPSTRKPLPSVFLDTEIAIFVTFRDV